MTISSFVSKIHGTFNFIFSVSVLVGSLSNLPGYFVVCVCLLFLRRDPNTFHWVFACGVDEVRRLSTDADS